LRITKLSLTAVAPRRQHHTFNIHHRACAVIVLSGTYHR